jgi:hypothetical protein
VVVYGPVADPEGVRGMGVLRAASRSAVLELGNNDPSVVAGVNTFEVFEIVGGLTGQSSRRYPQIEHYPQIGSVAAVRMR